MIERSNLTNTRHYLRSPRRLLVLVINSLLWIFVLTSCGKNNGKWECQEQLPVLQITFPDGSIKNCHKLQCYPYCVEWVCRDSVESELSCRPTVEEDAK